MHIRSLSLTAALSAILVSACGGGGSTPAAPSPTAAPPAAPAAPPPPPPSPGGIWFGTDPATGLDLLGLVTEAGEFHFIQEDGVQYFGTVNVSASGAASGNFRGVTPFGTTFVGGATTGTGTITSGSVTARSRLQVSTSFTTASGTANTATFTLAYDGLYDRDSSLSTIAGNFRDPDTNAVVNVNSNGVIFSQDPVSGCVLNGRASIVNQAYNAYRIEYTFSSCQGPAAPLNGTTATGLGTLDNTVSPEVAIIGVVNATAGYSLVGVYPRT